MITSNKKGQVALYILMGILLLVIALLFLFLLQDSESVDGDQLIPVDVDSIEFMVQDCIRDIGTEGLILLGKNGNYIPAIPNPLQHEDTSLWITEYNNVQPILNSSIENFQSWFNYNFEQCVDYSPFPGFVIQAGRADSTIEYAAEQVLISLNYPLNISKDGGYTALEEFDEVLNIRYRRIYERAKHIVEVHYIQDFDYRDAKAHVNAGEFIVDYEYNVSNINTLKWNITDPVEFEGQPFSFQFATNLNRSHNARRAVFTRDDTRCLIPFTLDSPDRLATVMILCGTYVHFPTGEVVGPDDVPGEINANYQILNSLITYEESATRPDVPYYVEYTIEGGIKPGRTDRRDITWMLTNPTYNFGPDGLEFKDENGNPNPQPLIVYWDEEKNPNHGPVGLLYRGPQSNYNWTPVQVEENYQQSFVATNILGFSEYAVVDCSFQQCKEARVKAKIKGGKGLKCFLKIIMDIIMVILIIIIIILAIFTAGGSLSLLGPLVTFIQGFGVTLAGLQTAALVVGAVYAGLTFAVPLDFGSDDTSVSPIATCDQILEISCYASGKLKSGYGEFNDETLPRSGTTEHIVEGGEPFRLSAVAKKCKTKKFKCSSCSLTCATAYK